MAALHKLTGNFAATDVDGELLIVDLDGGELFSLSGTARSVWDSIDGRRDESQIAEHLSAAFDVDAATLEADIAVFVEELRAAALIGPAK
ncbi:PqqD family protein [Qipengyuania gaetbuli]|uniref:PqqD family protein n=1 Tax=Qipengyuania gaetbuli TaxID=266952 RepID=UPI001CFDF769|nr:PqqD family protein [Qipengyuania gaetbuli]